MRKTFTHFEQVPVEVVEKILEQQATVTKRDDNPKRVLRKSKRAAGGPRTSPKKIEVLAP
jgi:hypothetical protein